MKKCNENVIRGFWVCNREFGLTLIGINYGQI